ncbi:hypothetical protein A2291_04285 [candidate division WOR-1 bacterium RIFOXYB2_FULL_42_35]|uniref:AbiEi antitoxin C-terminal domain-containing protein n=1 Tax=candidate division WOR-1 bacterium RIFOXYC2_FULL_41_25 TaxID=1802586 RepID=A0A1F4TR70_UNCSA|nr:MAG: hypothetical protein A2247_07400 [candidate division WOR-1 bacterium RIFOXYA2_FULL_41_14]OGC25783.1 MAG: hypothetical protein A2291_04285 [candidate division WOR-1 bacterium RIFOXYB2_FULL_42_35]OGC35224.1 MAG: hypothetical protein A2462_08275 [candidate division WOR-1 bacterium RIFOXYC2_FULL_41_25]OGC43290.1 MAG: hypothetical protein A2548_02040 [candidate division WOR-1 bacterium RIFOXYD2_FULL_41_8]
MKKGGISKRNREMLSILNREAKGPFGLDFVSKVLNISKTRAKNFVFLLVSQGWLTRIKSGLYSTVSLSTIRPEAQKEDPLVVAATVFAPCYIGGWSACEHWGLTEQIFNDIVVFSSRRFNKTKQIIQGTTYIIKTVSKKRFYGLRPVWRGKSKILLSDLSRTIVDILDTPKIGGGIRNVALIIREYFKSEERKDDNLLNYVNKYGNKVVCKRLGYLIEQLNIDAPDILKYCSKFKSSGYSKLDPTLPGQGKYLRRWNLVINAHLLGVVSE